MSQTGRNHAPARDQLMCPRSTVSRSLSHASPERFRPQLEARSLPGMREENALFAHAHQCSPTDVGRLDLFQLQLRNRQMGRANLAPGQQVDNLSKLTAESWPLTSFEACVPCPNLRRPAISSSHRALSVATVTLRRGSGRQRGFSAPMGRLTGHTVPRRAESDSGGR